MSDAADSTETPRRDPGQDRLDRLRRGPGGDRGGRAADRRGHPPGARRPARVAEADRQRELRLARRAAHDGHLVLRQVRRGHDRPPLLRRLPERRHRRGDRAPSTPASCSARRTPTCSRTPASTPTWSPSGRSWPTTSRRRALERLGAKNVNELSEADWETLRHEFGNQRLLGMSLDAGGHLTHGFRPNISGKMFHQQQYGTDPETGLLDYDVVRAKAKRVQAAGPDRRLLGVPAPGELRQDARDRRRGRRDADGRHGALRRAGGRQGVHRRRGPGAARPRHHDHHPQVAARPARRHGAGAGGVRRRRRPRLPDGARRPALAHDGGQGRSARRGPPAGVPRPTRRRSPTTRSRSPRGS